MTKTDVLVIGAGPAGLSAAAYAARAGYDVIAIDQLSPGGQLLLIDEIENYPGLALTNGYKLAEDMEKQATSFGAKIEFSALTSIKKEGEGRFIAQTDSGEIEAKAVIIAKAKKRTKVVVSVTVRHATDRSSEIRMSLSSVAEIQP